MTCYVAVTIHTNCVIHEIFMFYKHATERIIKFSESLGPSDLALWFFQEIGNDYRDDILKLKGRSRLLN